VFGLPNRTCLPKVSNSDPKRQPKGDQKPPTWMMSDLSKHSAITRQNQLFAISGELWEHTFATLLSGHYVFVVVFMTFEILRAKRVSKIMGASFASGPRN